MEKILVDGYNLLYKDGALKNLAERSLEAAREQLLGAIASYRSAEMEIVVVFDGRAGEGGRSGISPPGLEVRFSRYPETADEVILGILQKERRRRSVTVVTSDKKDIGRAARSEGVRWVSSEAFLRRLHRGGGRRRADEEKPFTTSPEEMKYWLERFRSEGRKTGD